MDDSLWPFPEPHTADANGLVVITKAITAPMLLAAYYQGLFPWTDEPVGWYSPDPRAVFIPEHVHLPSNLGKLTRRAGFTVTFDTHFPAVIAGCAAAHADDGEWITPRFVEAFTHLHSAGHAHSVEVWQQSALVGGLYGVQIGGVFAGESMFYRVPNASKVAFSALLQQAALHGIRLIDAQVLNAHTLTLGAVNIRRADYIRLLKSLRPPAILAHGTKW